MSHSFRCKYLPAAAALAASALLATAAAAAGNHAGGHGHGASIGAPGDTADTSRTIEIVMLDNSYEPAEIAVAKGETVRFVVRNDGEFVHEFNIGTGPMHAAHQKEMMAMMESGVLEADRINHAMMQGGKGGHAMAHNDPNSVLLEPGQSAELVWKFDTDATLEFACNVPG
ncbi:MAG: cupredoxin domain-containing protein, partial [Alphaproteobacteria bacterium]